MYTVENLSITEASFPFTWPQASFSEVATVNTFFRFLPEHSIEISPLKHPPYRKNWVICTAPYPL